MNKKYIFELQLYDSYSRLSIGYFNKIECLIKAKNYEEKMKRIRLYKGVFIEPYLYRDKYKAHSSLEIILNDINFNPIASFFVGNLNESKILYNKNFSELIHEGIYLDYDFAINPLILSLWLKRRKEIFMEKNTWLKLSRSQRSEWLSQISSDERYNCKNIKIENKLLEINGNIIDDEVSFYFTFGEEVYGVGGYMGSNIHAFEDCLSDKNIRASTLTLIWNNFEISKKGFYKNNEKIELQNILDILNEQGLKVIFK